MRPILLGLAAVLLFLGSLVMAPLTSEVAGSMCSAGHHSQRVGGCEVPPVDPLSR
jgi:hypothetical protein